MVPSSFCLQKDNSGVAKTDGASVYHMSHQDDFLVCLSPIPVLQPERRMPCNTLGIVSMSMFFFHSPSFVEVLYQVLVTDSFRIPCSFMLISTRVIYCYVVSEELRELSLVEYAFAASCDGYVTFLNNLNFRT